MSKQQTRYQLTLTVEEDLHSGTGTGDAKVDAVQMIDRYGFPVLRATHIKGLLRTLARQLYALDKTITEEQLRQLFGKDGQRQRGALLMQSPRLSNKTASWQVTWTSTARELNSRVPKEDTLRSRQYVAAGRVFKGELALTDESLLPLLQRCLKRMTHIGSQISRDAGRVRVQLEPVPIKKRLTLPMPTEKQLRLRLLLRNLDPIGLPITGYRGYLLRTECYIRGQQLLGAFVSWAITQEQVGQTQHLLERQISVGNAYPLPAVERQADWPLDQCSVQPFPLRIYTPKPAPATQVGPWWLALGSQTKYLGHSHEIDTFLETAKPDEKPNESSDTETDDKVYEKPKRPGDTEFLFRPDHTTPWQRYQPHIQVHLRNRMPKPQAAEEWFLKEELDELFAEEEIAEDTFFLSDILFSDRQTAEQFRETFLPVLQGESWLTIGRSGRPLQVEQAQWLDSEQTAMPTVDQFTLTLNSDLIARAPNLNFYDRLDPDMLAELAGLDSLDFTDMTWQELSETIEVRGFNASSGLPRAPVLAIRRGSSIRVAGAKAAELYQRLSSLPYLGERHWEGFGRFQLDFSPLGNDLVLQSDSTQFSRLTKGTQIQTPTQPIRSAKGNTDTVTTRIKKKGDSSHHPNIRLMDNGSTVDAMVGQRGQDNDLTLDLTIGKRESLLAKVEKLVEPKKIPLPASGGEGGPTKTQWQYLRQQVNIAKNIADVLECLGDLQKHAQQLGGKPWEKVPLSAIKQIVEKECQTLEQAQFFIDSLVRKQWLKIKKCVIT